ncbi:MAG: cupredoxin domain-containing protein [Pseudobdellovibrio sp.]
MSSANFKTAKNYINIFARSFLFAFFFFVQVKVHAQIVEAGDNKEAITAPHSESKSVMPTQATIVKPSDVSTKQKDEEILKAIHKAVQPVEPTNQIVILNTEKGFVPDKISVKKGEAYKIHVVNINMREKNVSFIMDSFTQSHNTVFATEKTFNIEPQIEGIYSYQCPETGVQGQLVVVSDEVSKKDMKRKLASEQ